ncbi:MAG: FliM/FliN family flagellar motor C-terminal domain-containing protein [Thermoguttaceae bacterium]|nr:FliM/FliN family flagellar motor C-terminal domain-containing protein [Thermoguttaceae bacterium]
MADSRSNYDTPVQRTIEVRLGRLRLPLREWLKHSTQTPWIFDGIPPCCSDVSGLPVEIYDQNRHLANGELVSIDGHLAIRICQRFPLSQ